MSCWPNRWKNDHRKILRLLATVRPPNWKPTSTTLPKYSASTQWRRSREASGSEVPGNSAPNRRSTASARQQRRQSDEVGVGRRLGRDHPLERQGGHDALHQGREDSRLAGDQPLDGGGGGAARQQAVERARPAAALHVAEDRGP